MPAYKNHREVKRRIIGKRTRIDWYYDRVRINSKTSLTYLRSNIPIGALEKECRSITIRVPYRVARKVGYKSRVEIIAPTKRFFEILLFHEMLLGEYVISKIEVAEDIACRSKPAARIAVKRLQKTLSKKYTARCTIAVVLKPCEWKT